MLREVAVFGALVSSFLLYFVASIVLFIVIDQALRRVAFYRLTWHPSLARFGLFLCLFAALVFSGKLLR